MGEFGFFGGEVVGVGGGFVGLVFFFFSSFKYQTIIFLQKPDFHNVY